MRDPVIRGIPELVAWRFGVTPNAMMSRRQDKAVAIPRLVSMWLAVRIAHEMFGMVAGYFERDRTTVISGVQRIDRLMASDAAFAGVVWDLASRLDADEASDLRRTMIRRVA